MTDHTERGIALAVANCLAVLLFVFGLISPLTPSEGRPEPGAIGVFVGLPLAVILVSIGLVRRWASRAVLSLLAALVALLAVLVLQVDVAS